MSLLTTHSAELREFVQQVQNRAQLESYEEAHQLSRATLMALGQTISGGQAKQLGGWLPPELADELGGQHGQASAFDKRGFLEKIGAEVYSVDQERVEAQANAALRTLRSTAPAGQLDDTIAQLPPELAALFD